MNFAAHPPARTSNIILNHDQAVILPQISMLCNPTNVRTRILGPDLFKLIINKINPIFNNYFIMKKK